MRDWGNEPLERLAEIRSSNVDKKSNPGEQPVRLCNYMDVYSRDYVTEDIEFMEATATAAEIQRFGIERGDVMITKDSETPDDIGIPVVVLDEIPSLVCGYHVALIKPKRDEVDSVYLAKQLASVDTARYFGRLANGSTRYGLSYQSIANTPIRLAPLPQQKRIAEILSTVDEAIEQTEALIAKTQQIKAGLMHDLFTRGVTKDGHLRPPREEAPHLYKESPLGWIPKEWDVCPIENLLERIIDYRGKTPTKTLAGIPLLTAKNIRMGFIDSEPREFIAENDYSSWMTRGIPSPSDVLFTTEAPLGNVAQVGTSDKVAFAQRVIILRPRVGIRASWLKYRLMAMDFQDCVARRSSGTTALGVKQSEFRKIFTSFSLERNEQFAIERVLIGIEERQTHELEINAKLRALKAGLMHDLLTGRKRVKASEPATA